MIPLSLPEEQNELETTIVEGDEADAAQEITDNYFMGYSKILRQNLRRSSVGRSRMSTDNASQRFSRPLTPQGRVHEIPFP